MEAPAPRAMSDAEEAHIRANVDQFQRFVALTRMGAGGVAQLRRFYLDQIDVLKHELNARPRVRDFKKPEPSAPAAPPTSCPSCAEVKLWSPGDSKCFACGAGVAEVMAP